MSLVPKALEKHIPNSPGSHTKFPEKCIHNGWKVVNFLQDVHEELARLKLRSE